MTSVSLAEEKSGEHRPRLSRRQFGWQDEAGAAARRLAMKYEQLGEMDLALLWRRRVVALRPHPSAAAARRVWTAARQAGARARAAGAAL